MSIAMEQPVCLAQLQYSSSEQSPGSTISSVATKISLLHSRRLAGPELDGTRTVGDSADDLTECSSESPRYEELRVPRHSSISTVDDSSDDITECSSKPLKNEALRDLRQSSIRTVGDPSDEITECSSESPRYEASRFPNRGSFTRFARQNSLHALYEKAQAKQRKLKRSPLTQRIFQYSVYTGLFIFLYLVLVGLPLWNGAVYWGYEFIKFVFVVAGGFVVFVGIAALYAILPLFILFDEDPPQADPAYVPESCEVALMIPCYKSGSLIAATLTSALKIFPKENIFVIANGNSPTPLDNTGDVCAEFGVSHTWCPLGSKIIAQYVGCYVTKKFKYALLIDDDCLLPANFPLSTDKFNDQVKCIGYTITSVGPNCTKGTLVQQAQDLEYKLSGLQRQFAGLVGSATFPHGAISMWDRNFLLQTFNEHPGFSVSEDWFFGHVARVLGSRILMNSEVFVETETPDAIFFAAAGGERGGFGEMTVYKQRFERWNFFFVNGIYWNMRYIICNWKLGWWEIGAKLFVFQEVYETLLYILTPFVLPMSFVIAPMFCLILLLGTLGLYMGVTLVFNYVHLRRKIKIDPESPTGFSNQSLGWKALLYYMPYKAVLTLVNVASCYWSIWMYAKYFGKRHPKVIEDEKVVELVMRMRDEIERREQVGLTSQEQKIRESIDLTMYRLLFRDEGSMV